MTSQELRQAFIDYFVRNGHLAVPSASLIPDEMSTTLFTIAGMEQFVPVFLGDAPAPAPRVVTVQRCLRVAGAKSDIENVGRTGRHGTFLEMLGNFSFGDYYKSEAIRFAWEFVTERDEARPGPAARHRAHLRRRGAAHLGERDRPRPGAHLALGRGQLLDDGPDRPVRSVQRDLLRHRGREQRRAGGHRAQPGRPLRGDLERRVPAVQPRRRRCAERVAAQVDRYRRGPGAHARGRQRHVLDVRDRPLHRHRGGAAAGRPDDARAGRPARAAAHHRRPRAGGDVPDRRRRVPLQQRARLRAALPDSAGDPQRPAAGLPARVHGRTSRRRRHLAGERLSRIAGQAARRAARAAQRGDGLPAHARPRHGTARSRDRRGAARLHDADLGRRCLRAARHLRLSVRADARDRRRARGGGRHGRLRAPDGRAARARAGRRGRQAGRGQRHRPAHPLLGLRRLRRARGRRNAASDPHRRGRAPRRCRAPVPKPS